MGIRSGNVWGSGRFGRHTAGLSRARSGGIVAVALAALVSGGAAVAQCTTAAVELRGEWGKARFAVDVADDPQERAQGLMNVPAMPLMTGMLFLYEKEQPTSFWMRNTLIPLDMLFMDDTGTITHIHENAVPLDETPIPGGDNVRAVLEINGGLAARLGIEEGTVLRHPGLPQDEAAWSCGS